MSVYVGTFGTRIEIVGQDSLDLSGAVSAQINFVKPGGTSGSWTATVVDNVVRYTTDADDLDEAGTWQIQAFVDLGTWRGYSTIESFTVEEPL
jgi:hypothetical protein